MFFVSFAVAKAGQYRGGRSPNNSTDIEHLYQRFERLDLLPNGFSKDKLQDEINFSECVGLIARVSDWGEKLWIERTSSNVNRFFLKVRRYFGYLNADTAFLLDISHSPNARSLMMARRWIRNVPVHRLEGSVSGWQMMEFEYEALSRMLSMAGIPRTLNEEIELLLYEIDNIQTDIAELYSQDTIDEMTGLDVYSGNKYMWVYYLSGLQHGLLPSDLVKPSFVERDPPNELLNRRLTISDALRIAECMVEYIDALTGEITGYDERTSILKEVLYNRSLVIARVANHFLNK